MKDPIIYDETASRMTRLLTIGLCANAWEHHQAGIRALEVSDRRGRGYKRDGHSYTQDSHFDEVWLIGEQMSIGPRPYDLSSGVPAGIQVDGSILPHPDFEPTVEMAKYAEARGLCAYLIYTYDHFCQRIDIPGMPNDAERFTMDDLETIDFAAREALNDDMEGAYKVRRFLEWNSQSPDPTAQ